mmetsp:Transcript_18671/g.74558  ORF Transcript_18671/g.74558 Transcript_18671/m.74558 type:complete len:206 (-) Transcript_18671:514-1131(-)
MPLRLDLHGSKAGTPSAGGRGCDDEGANRPGAAASAVSPPATRPRRIMEASSSRASARAISASLEASAARRSSASSRRAISASAEESAARFSSASSWRAISASRDVFGTGTQALQRGAAALASTHDGHDAHDHSSRPERSGGTAATRGGAASSSSLAVRSMGVWAAFGGGAARHTGAGASALTTGFFLSPEVVVAVVVPAGEPFF